MKSSDNIIHRLLYIIYNEENIKYIINKYTQNTDSFSQLKGGILISMNMEKYNLL